MLTARVSVLRMARGGNSLSSARLLLAVRTALEFFLTPLGLRSHGQNKEI